MSGVITCCCCLPTSVGVVLPEVSPSTPVARDSTDACLVATPLVMVGPRGCPKRLVGTCRCYLDYVSSARCNEPELSCTGISISWGLPFDTATFWTSWPVPSAAGATTAGVQMDSAAACG